jgi:predicted nucleic acid-binding protein
MTICMENKNREILIADTSGLVSLFVPTDQNHTEAVAAATALTNARRDILVPAAVFVELLNILGRKVGHAQALAAAAELRPPFLVLAEPASLQGSPALKKFAGSAPGVSFTDCLVMALADEYGTREIFGFDKQFADAGYTRLAPAKGWKDAA